MPALQTFLAAMNTAFAHENIQKTVKQREAFRPGPSLDGAIDAVIGAASPLNSHLKRYLGTAPPSIVAGLLAISYDALGRAHPTSIVFNWSPAYDFELVVWEAPDTGATRGGIAITVKGRYPDDPHPLSAPAAA
jgi:hypothetical protein